MKKSLRTVLSLTVASAMILSMASCSLFDKSKDEVLDAVDSYAKNVTKAAASKLISSSTDDVDDDSERIEAMLNFVEGDLYSADQAAAYSAIASTLSYEVDEESVEASAKDGEGSVDVVFTIADYESVAADEEACADVDAFIAAINAAETTEIEVTIEFEKEDDEWLCSNTAEVVDKVFEFTTLGLEFAPSLVDAVSGTTWWFSDDGNGTYTNETRIDLDINFAGGTDYSEVYYTVTFGGNVIYTSGAGEREGYYRASFEGAPLTDEGYLQAGQYTITFYDGAGNELASGTATVNVEEQPVNVNDVSFTWWFSDDGNGTYRNETRIDLDINLGSSGISSSQVYYTVAFNGSQVYRSADGEREGYYRASFDGAPVTANGNLEAGLYDIQFFMLDGTPLGGDTAVVYNDQSAEQPSGGSSNGDYTVGQMYYETQTGDFFMGTGAPIWYNIATGSQVADGVYSSGTDAIQLAIQAQDNSFGDVTYTFYYLPDGEIANAQEVFSDTISLTEYPWTSGEGSNWWYDCTYDGDIQNGIYGVEIEYDGQLQVTSFCQVGN